MYRKDRKKEGGWNIVYIFLIIGLKRVKILIFKYIEVLVIVMKINNKDFLLIGVYRLFEVMGKDYYLIMEGEFNLWFMLVEL